MSVNYKIGADVGNFKQGMAEAQASLRTLDAALKNNEASFKAGGDSQVYMEQKSKLLNDKMKQQKQLASQLQDQLKKMRENGVRPTSTEYQNLQTKLLNAQTAMNETKVALDNLDGSQQQAATSAGNLADSINSIGKKISLEQVISGIGSITSALETAAGKAVNLGETIWNNVMSSAQWADDSATMALMYGVDLDTFLRVQKLVQNGMDTSVEAILKSQQKLTKQVGSGAANDVLEELGLMVETVGKFGSTSAAAKDPADLFWDAGKAIMALGDAYEQEEKAQKLFGKSWRELIPLFTQFSSQEEYEKALENVNVNTEDEVNDLALLNDKVAELQGNLQTLMNKGWAALAPALTSASEALNGLLSRVLEYLDSAEGQEALKTMSDSISSLFDDLGKIDPESVVQNLTSVFDKIVGGFKWLGENKDSVVEALKYIVAGWAGLKITGGALTVLELISGLRGLSGNGTPSGNEGGQAATVAGGGTSWLGRMISGASAKVSAMNASNVGLWGAILQDYFYNNTYTGQVARNTGSLLEGVKQGTAHFGETVRANAASFAGDWAGVAQEAYRASWWDDIFEYYAKQAETLKKNMELSAEELQKWGLIAPSASESSILGKPGQLIEEWEALFGDNKVEVPTEPEVPENAAEDIASQIGTVTVPIRLGTRDIWASFTGGAGAGGSHGQLMQMHANGIWSVPFDNYPALLHRGERVVPAREVGSRSFNSNVYVEKMVMNNGTDAQGLANAMTAANRRRMSGYGS